MNNTAILVMIAIVAVAGIFWLVIYSGRRGREHREKTTIKAPESHRQSPPRWSGRLVSLSQLPVHTRIALVTDGNPARRGPARRGEQWVAKLDSQIRKLL